jgi:DNA-binding GntR family transcriptional regulator
MPFAKLKQVNLREELVVSIREAILNGQLRPGERIVEYKVARELAVSQNSVREALIVLEQQGLVTRIANKGAFVTKLSPEAMEQIYLVRVELEALTVKFAKQHMRLVDADQLQQDIEEMRRAAKSADRVAFCRADFEFHQRLWGFSNNPYLVKALASIVVPQFSYLLIRSFSIPPEHFLTIVDKHQQMLDFIKNLSPEQAAAETKELIHQLCNYAMPLLHEAEASASGDGAAPDNELEGGENRSISSPPMRSDPPA